LSSKPYPVRFQALQRVSGASAVDFSEDMFMPEGKDFFPADQMASHHNAYHG